MSKTIQLAALPAEPEHLDFSAATEADLLEWMAAADTCQTDARAAFAEFHRRHAAYLYAVCERRYRVEAEDIAADTLLRVYERAVTFDLERIRGSATPLASRVVRAWMGTIAHHIAADYLADRKRSPRVVTPERITSLPDKTCCDPAKDHPVLDAELIRRVREVISGLPEREQDIAWVIAHCWSPDHEQIRWSNEDLDNIAERYGLKRENIRQIRSRLLKKLWTLLTPILGGSGSAR